MKVFITLAAFAVAGLGSALVTPSASAQTNPRSVTISDADCTAALGNSLVNGSGQAKSSGSNSWN